MWMTFPTYRSVFAQCSCSPRVFHSRHFRHGLPLPFLIIDHDRAVVWPGAGAVSTVTRRGVWRPKSARARPDRVSAFETRASGLLWRSVRLTRRAPSARLTGGIAAGCHAERSKSQPHQHGHEQGVASHLTTHRQVAFSASGPRPPRSGAAAAPPAPAARNVPPAAHPSGPPPECTE